MKVRRGTLALTFGLGAVLVALAGLLYIVQTIVDAARVLIEIGAMPHG